VIFQGSDTAWAVAFLLPYAAVFVFCVLYPLGIALWLGGRPHLFVELFEDPNYLRTVGNTLLFVGIGVNLKMFLALLLSGLFIRRGWRVRAIFMFFILPWALPALPAFLSIHWMFIGWGGLVHNFLVVLFDTDGPIWFNDRWLAMGTNIYAYMWKWLPFWTVVFMAARVAIPKEIYEAAEVDGANGPRRFVHITFPLLANLYLVCTLLSTAWTIGDFTTVAFVSGGAPALQTQVLATPGSRTAVSIANPPLGIATMLSALPLLIPLVILLMRRVHKSGIQL